MNYNKELVDASRDIIGVLGMVGFIVGLFLCVVCYKYRHVSKVLFYFECIVGTIYTMMANEEQEYFQLFFIWLVLLFCFYTDSAYQIIFGCITLAVNIFFVLPMFHLTRVHWLNLTTNLILLISFFFVATIFGMFSIFVSQMYLHLDASNTQNIKLLNGMHEGLLIIDKRGKSTMFCNRPAQKLISTFLGPLIKDTSANF